MVLEKVAQHDRQLGGVARVSRGNCGAYIIDDHLADALSPASLVKQIMGQCRC